MAQPREHEGWTRQWIAEFARIRVFFLCAARLQLLASNQYALIPKDVSATCILVATYLPFRKDTDWRQWGVWKEIQAHSGLRFDNLFLFYFSICYWLRYFI